jgi:hypothetical protein
MFTISREVLRTVVHDPTYLKLFDKIKKAFPAGKIPKAGKGSDFPILSTSNFAQGLQVTMGF